MAPAGPGALAPSVSTQVDTGVSLPGDSFAYIATNGDVSTVLRSNTGLGQRTAAVESSDSNLLLLDLAWAGVDDASYDFADDSLYDSSRTKRRMSATLLWRPS